MTDRKGFLLMDIVFKGRHTDVLERFRKHATGKLAKMEKLDPKAISVDVEVTTERNPRQSDRKERVELTITTRGPAIRAEAAAEDRFAALDLALAKLESRLRRACDRRKDRHVGARGLERPEVTEDAPVLSDEDLAAAAARSPGRTAARSAGQSVPKTRPAGKSVPKSRPAADARPAPAAASRAADPAANGISGDGQTTPDLAEADAIVAIQMQGDGPLVVREKVHKACPMTIDQALFEMELIGHDFFLFTDSTAGLPSVVYRRRGYQYGVIRLVEEPAVLPGAAGPGLANGRPQQAANLASG
jgi:ribosomal subunit interface protein